ncbi:alpha/beta fold hydrolase [Methylorubrum thiocyanatum]|uniref:alpha/beta fold hydrolase n=1 Tax=Methylorubrum thiocyanatum TaxID=47958 RepID=UPI00383B2264
MLIARRSVLKWGLPAVFWTQGCGRVLAGRNETFDSAGVRLHYVDGGSGDPVILVHGYTMDTEREFGRTGVLDALSAHYRTFGLDERGHGASEKPHDPAAYGPTMGDDIVSLMDHLALPRAHVVGYSMGAHVVAQLLTRRPERFLSATLGGSPGRYSWTENDQHRVEVEANEMDAGSVRSQILRLWPRDIPPPGEDELRRRSDAQLAGQDPKALAAVRRSNRDQTVTFAQMAAVQVPTLGIVGSLDPYREGFVRLKAAKPQLDLVVVEGATHGSLPGRSEFVKSILAFLDAHPA